MEGNQQPEGSQHDGLSGAMGARQGIGTAHLAPPLPT